MMNFRTDGARLIGRPLMCIAFLGTAAGMMLPSANSKDFLHFLAPKVLYAASSVRVSMSKIPPIGP
jgi:hypothetical protein